MDKSGTKKCSNDEIIENEGRDDKERMRSFKEQRETGKENLHM